MLTEAATCAVVGGMRQTSIGLRDLKKQITRTSIASAALRLAVERGLEQVTLDEIAEQAFVSPRTVSNYFSGKEEAIAAAGRDLQDSIIEDLARRPTNDRRGVAAPGHGRLRPLPDPRGARGAAPEAPARRAAPGHQCLLDGAVRVRGGDAATRTGRPDRDRQRRRHLSVGAGGCGSRGSQDRGHPVGEVGSDREELVSMLQTFLRTCITVWKRLRPGSRSADRPHASGAADGTDTFRSPRAGTARASLTQGQSWSSFRRSAGGGQPRALDAFCVLHDDVLGGQGDRRPHRRSPPRSPRGSCRPLRCGPWPTPVWRRRGVVGVQGGLRGLEQQEDWSYWRSETSTTFAQAASVPSASDRSAARVLRSSSVAARSSRTRPARR